MRPGVPRRTVPGLLLVACLAPLAACGAQVADHAQEFGGGNNPDFSATASPTRPCQARVALTGALQDSWSGSGSVLATPVAGPTSIYVSRHGPVVVRLFSSGLNNAPNVRVSDGARGWGISPPAQGRIRPSGSGATVSTPLVSTGVSSHEVHLQASFHC